MYDVIIMGGGAAGMTAAIYSARKKLNTLVLEYERGGQTALQPEIWNYPGYTELDGRKLLDTFRKQALSFGAEMKSFRVEKISSEKDGNDHDFFSVEDKNGNKLETKALIIATGAKPKMLGVPGEDTFYNKGVTYCATCDAPLFDGKAVAVVGAGNTGLDAALMLTKYASKIYILIRSESVKGDPVTKEKLEKDEKVEFIFNAESKEVKGDKFVSGLVYNDKKNKEEKELAVSGVFISIGSLPNSDFLKGFCDLNQWGQVVINPRTNATSRAGVFAAGDVCDIDERQTIIAAGEGAKAALQCYKWLSSKH
ncbi:FAD-dependent oxidoreductase [Candidatus Azambacteria bacterium]|nr:FAD-dependent oxidoreductase [Candidatus Azambacteria bacterium]